MNENERKAREFLEYVSKNIDLLKNNLRKNITFNKNIFDDSLNESIIKVYNSIIKNGTEVKDWKQYFFMASKWNYVMNDNRNKKKQEIEVRGIFDNGETIDMYEESIDENEIYNKTFYSLQAISDLITLNFSPLHTEIYMKYMMGKATKKKTSYKSIAQDFNMSVKDITNIINEVKNFLIEKQDLINKIKSEYIE